VVSNGIQASIDALPGVSVTRIGGVDRYDTSFLINNAFFNSISRVFLATGTGYADALAGAAFTGAEAIPLFTVKPNCVPVPMLHKFALLGATDFDLLGGTGALDAHVFALAACAYTPVPEP
jgi:putative cell wall-binding protein